MLTDADRRWYSEVLSDAMLGTAKLGFADVARIGSCGKNAAGDKLLLAMTLAAVHRKAAHAGKLMEMIGSGQVAIHP